MVISFLFLLLRKNACLLKVDRHNAKTPTLPTKVRWATTHGGARTLDFQYSYIHKTGTWNCSTFTIVTSDHLSYASFAKMHLVRFVGALF